MKLRATVLAILVAGVGGFLLWIYLKRFEAEASGGARIGVLMTVRTLEPGSILRDEDIGERFIPQAYIETRAIHSTDRSRIINLRISAPLQAQQTLMWTDIVLANDDTQNLSAYVQPGMRAVTVHVDGKEATLVHPGDRVDVLGTFPQPGNTDNRVGVVLLQNVLVLGHGTESNNESHGVNPEQNDLALSLTLENAQKLRVAADKGKLSVALRNLDDVRIQEGLKEVSSTALTQAIERAAAAAPKAGPTEMKSGGR
jgi:pilus assembly protein CpaB